MLSTVEFNQDETFHNHDLLSLATTRAIAQWLKQPICFFLKVSVYALVWLYTFLLCCISLSCSGVAACSLTMHHTSSDVLRLPKHSLVNGTQLPVPADKENSL